MHTRCHQLALHTAAVALLLAVACSKDGDPVGPGPQTAYTLSMDPATPTVVQGAGGSAQIRITRTAFAGAVDLTVTGAPTGVTATLSPASVTGDVATLTVNAAGNAATGNFALTPSGQAQGMANRTASLALTVTAPPAGGALVWNFCASSAPIWLAYQNDSGPWTQLSVAPASAVNIPIDSRGGVAFVTRTTTSIGELYHLTVFYGTTAQLRVQGEDWCASFGGGKQVSGTVANVPSSAFASLGISSAQVPPGTTTFTLAGVPDGPRDLVASRVSRARCSFSVYRPGNLLGGERGAGSPVVARGVAAWRHVRMSRTHPTAPAGRTCARLPASTAAAGSRAGRARGSTINSGLPQHADRRSRNVLTGQNGRHAAPRSTE